MTWCGMEEIMPEFTQEQIDQLIAEKIAESKKGLLTEEEVARRVTAEADRRVESGIQKGLETQRQKWEKEFSEKAKLSAEELAKKELDEKTQGLTQREIEIKRRANKLEAKEMLSEASIPKANYETFMSVLVSDDEEATKANVTSFIEMYNATKTDIETRLKTEMSKVPPPNNSGGDKPVSKADFDKMGYADKVAFKSKHPDLYKQFMK
jgi:Domain of unknown function (DUF4355)